MYTMGKYKWKLEFTLNSGKVIEGVMICDFDNSGKVAEKILNVRDNTYFGFLDTTEKHNILVKIENVAALDISPYIL